ncbi:hypothetical protein [Inmirania thermothiophila]|uniref:Uncharacterized protein n=1 Tax=Inmirania thermothiophila TaxID=1750597 RepID=A0A3N1Y1I7_9GAMM|nr:hypothetical protein [Inmirania thermothiophila]ROR32696.1 hypothetical protein EDC57_1903 [Inmirania thermothiophila]
MHHPTTAGAVPARALPPLLRTFVAAAVAAGLAAAPGGADAALLERLKEKAGKALGSAIPGGQGSRPEPAGGGTAPEPAATAAAPLIGSVDHLMARWPYRTPKGGRAAAVALRGVRLGQPLPEAHRALLEAGFSHVDQVGATYNYRMQYVEAAGARRWVPQSEVSALRKEPGFRVIRTLHMRIEAVTPSKAILAELAPYPAQPARPRGAGAATDARSARTRRPPQPASGPRLPPQPLYVSEIVYLQRFISGEQVDWPALLRQARERFGEPNYALPDIQRQGAAYKSSGAGSLWYLDAALEEPARIRRILATVEPDRPQSDLRTMVWKDMMHPGIFANVSYATQGFAGYEQAVEAMRVAGAPFLAVTRSNGLMVRLSWPFLKYEASARRIHDEAQARGARPKADVRF